MKTLLLSSVIGMLLMQTDCFRGDGGSGEKWKVVRNPGTNNCLAVVSTAMDPDKPEVLGTYNSQQAAISALNSFKSTPDDQKAGFEKCM
jgi:hypothetical protein